MRTTVVLALAGLSFLAAAPAYAHHSAAMFDREKVVTLEGTVKEFQWTNPHCWLQLVVQREGKAVEYSLEGQAVNLLVRQGWRPGSVKAGEKISVTMHPLRNGAAGGQLMVVTKADGSKFATNY